MVKYCPMCNRRTGLAQAWVDPFLVTTCAVCGHVHTIVERVPAW